jgi:hypothetical protein
MAQWVNTWRIITPNSRKAAYTQPTANIDDVMDLNTAGYAAFSSVSWFSQLLKGAGQRHQRYKQYDAMDTGDITRALDIIAEEISAPDKRTGLPFIIDYQTEENQKLPDTTVTTVRAALRHWSKFHGLNKRIFNVARMMVKYGDCFFRKTSDTHKWEFIDPTRVVGIEVDREGNKVNYHIRPSSFQSTISQNSGRGANAGDSIEITPASAMIHFTLSDEMGDRAPFGISVLQSAFKDYQKLTMLEDAAIIYRIVRAPERRVFFIDVGNMPPQRVKQYIEQVKNDIRQKRMPNTGNADQTDSQYNPESIQEDYFFPVTAAGRGSRVETLPGGASWEIPELDYFMNKVFRALRVPTSYMKGQDSANPGGMYNDGKVGVAYMEERIFANYIMRLQAAIDEVFDEQFKTYLAVTGINIDPDLFKLIMVEPQNFALYRQAALDTDLINSFKNIEDTPYLSKRFLIERFLGLTKDEMQMNEALVRQERGLRDDVGVDIIQQIYDPVVYENREKIKIDEPEEPEEPVADDTAAEPAGDEAAPQ